MRMMTSLQSEPNIKDSQNGLLRSIAIGGAVIALVFLVPIFQWLLLGVRSEIQSYLLLIPVISVYLVWSRKEETPWEAGVSMSACLAWGTFGVISGLLYLASHARGLILPQADALTFALASLVCFVNCLAAGHLSARTRVALRFPLLFLFLSVPMPHAMQEGMETFLQHASAEVTEWFFIATRMSHVRDGLIFQLPGISIRVAQECSGIRSTLVLFITSLVAGHLMLQSTANRVGLVIATWVLGIIRNAFRILVISWLCVEKGPHMIDSAIHRQGGPLFFLVSLLPLGGLLWLMVRTESRRRSPAVPPGSAPAVKCP